MSNSGSQHWSDVEHPLPSANQKAGNEVTTDDIRSLVADITADVDVTYDDNPLRPDIKIHQEDHDLVRAALALIPDEIDAATGAPLSQTINNQTGTGYTLVLADAGKVVRCANASPVTLIVPPNSSVAFPIGTRVDITQSGAGALTIAAGSGVTINQPASLTLVLSERWSSVTLVKVATNEWDIAGDLTAV